MVNREDSIFDIIKSGKVPKMTEKDAIAAKELGTFALKVFLEVYQSTKELGRSAKNEIKREHAKLLGARETGNPIEIYKCTKEVHQAVESRIIVLSGNMALRKKYTTAHQRLETKVGILTRYKNRLAKQIEQIEKSLPDLKNQKFEISEIQKSEISKKLGLPQSNNPITLSKVFTAASKYDYLIGILIEKDFCDPHTHKWIDNKKGNKSLLIAILKQLYPLGYSRRLSNDEIQQIALNTFDYAVGIDTIKKTTHEKHDLSFLIPASQVS